MTFEQNIKAILECNFSIAKDEIIEVTTKRIIEQISKQNPIEDLIMEYINFIISEECEGCTDCNPLSDIRACYVEGRAKWYVVMLNKFVKENKHE